MLQIETTVTAFTRPHSLGTSSAKSHQLRDQTNLKNCTESKVPLDESGGLRELASRVQGKHLICSQFLSLTNTLTQSFTQTLKLGTISIVTQHTAFDYRWVRAGLAYCTIHLQREAPFIKISSSCLAHAHTHWNKVYNYKKKNYNHML